MSKHHPEPKRVSTSLDPEFLLEIRHQANRSGIPAAEVMRNFLATVDQDVPSLSMDGCMAVAPDFNAEFAGLLAYQQAMDRQCREHGDDP